MPFYQDRWFPTQHGHEDYMIVPLTGFGIIGKRLAHLSRRTGAITVQRVAIGIGIPYAQDKSEVDFLLQGGHLVFL